jgi:hypothetical protein
VVAGLAAGVHALFVVVGAEVLVAGVRVGKQGVDAGEHGVAGRDQGLLFGMRLASRRYLAPRNDWVRLVLIVASPRAAPR